MASFKNLFAVATWSRVVPGIKDAVTRFPLPVVCVIGASLLAVMIIHEFTFSERQLVTKLLLCMIYGALALTSLKLLVESKVWSLGRHMLAAIVVMAVVVYYVWLVYDEVLFSTSVYFTTVLLLSLLFAPYIRRNSDQPSVWFFNYQTGVAVFFAVIAALVLGAGISIILSSLHYLFDIKISSKLYGDVWVLSWSLLFPVYVLANLSRQFDFEANSCGFPSGVRFITNYILLPLMLVYMVILYAYFVRVCLQWELPRGNLTWMIAVFGSLGIVTKLLAYPIRHDGTRLLTWFDRYYYHALLVPIILLAIAIGVRIHQYGVTEKRYTIVLMGVWFSSVALLAIFKKDHFHIKYVPMILAVLALLGSIGPWGAVHVTMTSQVGRLETFLTNHQMFRDGQVVKAKTEMTFQERKTLSSIADYVCATEVAYRRVRPWFQTLIDASGDKDCQTRTRLRSDQLLKLMGVSFVNRWQSAKSIDSFDYNNQASDSNQVLVDVSGFDFAGRGSMYQYNRKTLLNTFVLSYQHKPEKITTESAGDKFSVKTENGDVVEFDLGGLIRNLREQHVTSITPSERGLLTLTGNSSSGRLRARLILERIQGTRNQKDVNINSMQYLLLLKLNDQ